MSLSSRSVSVRLDKALVQRGLARSRGQAKELVLAGEIKVNQETVHKVSQLVGEADLVETSSPPLKWVSRSAEKLCTALEQFPEAAAVLPGAHVLDVGACTGGFTQVVLEYGARRVTALDVGHSQLVAQLAQDPRVITLEGHNIRTQEVPFAPYDFAVCDVSFISSTLALPNISHSLRHGGNIVLLVKPQFEVDPAARKSRGIVASRADRHEAIDRVISVAELHNLGVRGLCASRIRGATGNQEYLLWLQKGVQTMDRTEKKRVMGDLR